MVAARPYRVHGSCSFIVVAHSWQLLVHGGRSSMVVARSWQFLVYNSCSSMRNCTILKGNSSSGLYDENHMISNHSYVGGAILP